MKLRSNLVTFGALLVGALVALPIAATAEPVSTVSKQVTTEHNKSGIVGRFVLGGSALTSDDDDTYSAVGLRIGGTVGYQIPLTAKISITPEIWLDYSGWSGDHDASSSMFVFAAGAQADYFFLHNLSGWGGVHLGGGSIGAEQGGMDVSKGGFALAIDAGATYYLHQYVGVGAFLGVTSVFAGKDDKTQHEFSTTSFDFGLQVRGSFTI